MSTYLPNFALLKSQENHLITLLESWVNINSWSENLEGLALMMKTVQNAFKDLKGEVQEIPLKDRTKIDARGQLLKIPSASALSIKKHPHAPIQVLLAGHIDTVYPPQSSFQKLEKIDSNTFRGPGVIDMKGGLLIMLKALNFIESSPLAGTIGWEVLINPDEELGSPSSDILFIERAPHYDFGLIFEPAFPDGSIVNERKGSVNYTCVSKGRAAHAGRDYYSGRNAITPMARFVHEIENLNDRQRGITVNVGSFEGGGPTNIVPDLAICKVNIRMKNPLDFSYISANMHEIANRCQIEGISLELHEHTLRPPKPFDKPHRHLFEALKSCAQDLKQDLQWQPSGGVCDGNTLASAGLPTIDTLGAVGGHMHTHDEFILLSSLSERIFLTTAFLMHMAENKPLLGDRT